VTAYEAGELLLKWVDRADGLTAAERAVLAFLKTRLNTRAG
jgi:hypothetical protein